MRSFVLVFLLASAVLPAWAEIATDILSASNMVRQTSASGTNYFIGRVGIGTNQPAEALDVNGRIKAGGNIMLNGKWLSGDGDNEGVAVSSDGNVGIGASAGAHRLYVGHSTVDQDAGSAVRVDFSGTATTTNTLRFKAAFISAVPAVSAGVTNGGYLIAENISLLPTSGLAGDLGGMEGLRVEFGMGTGAVGHATSVYGLRLQPYALSGSIGDLYGVRIEAPSGSLASNQYPVWSGWDAPSYFAGSLGLGTATPTEKLHVVGTARFDAGITYIPRTGDLQMGVFTNTP